VAVAARPDAQAIARLLRPRSVAIIGASPTPGALGASVLGNLQRLHFGGQVYLVNPRRSHIGDRPCLQSVDELPLGVDAAVLAIPRAAVLENVKALAARQVGAAVIFSAGFAEGGEAGLQEQREIARVAADCGMVIEGPNCLGFVNHVDGIALTFVETAHLPLGQRPGIGIVSQSGAMAAVLGVMLASRELGISYSISTGNEAASGVEDYLDFLLADLHTQVIAMIVEQFRQPRRLLEIAARARAVGKSIVLLHPGRSSAARQSAATHTGALAGDHALMRTKVRRQGVVLVDSLEELGDAAEIALRCPLPRSADSVVVTESGAFKALALDLCEHIGLPLPTIDDQSAPLLRAAIPQFVPVSNPLDLTAQALVDPDIYHRTLAALVGDERFGSIIFTIIQTDATTSDLKFPPIIAAIRALKPGTPVILAGLDEGAEVPAHYIRELRTLGIPYFASPDRAMRAVARLGAAAARHPAIGTGTGAANGTGARSRTSLPVGIIAEYRAKQMLADIGIAFPPGRLVRTLLEAQLAARDIGYPVVLKAQSAALSHKSDAGGVVLGLMHPEALTAGWDRLHANIARHRPGLDLDGVLVETMSAPGVELIIGARNDADWGTVLLAGFGGVQAEILKDVRLLTPDMSTAEVLAELDRLQSAPVLRGYRGSPPLDVQAVAEIIGRLGRWLSAEPTVREIDLNPVIVYPAGQGAIALDALIRIGDQRSYLPGV